MFVRAGVVSERIEEIRESLSKIGWTKYRVYYKKRYCSIVGVSQFRDIFGGYHFRIKMPSQVHKKETAMLAAAGRRELYVESD